MQGKFVIEKSCRIGVNDITFVSISCSYCQSELNIAPNRAGKVNGCPVCNTPYHKDELESIEALVEAIAFFKKSKVMNVSVTAKQGGDDER